jgi:hypothetical protein
VRYAQLILWDLRNVSNYLFYHDVGIRASSRFIAETDHKQRYKSADILGFELHCFGVTENVSNG